jgi:hypothetical protein
MFMFEGHHPVPRRPIASLPTSLLAAEIWYNEARGTLCIVCDHGCRFSIWEAILCGGPFAHRAHETDILLPLQNTFARWQLAPLIVCAWSPRMNNFDLLGDCL